MKTKINFRTHKNPHIVELLDKFGGATGLAKLLELHPLTINGWLNLRIPTGRAYQIQVLTGGEFKAQDLLKKF